MMITSILYKTPELVSRAPLLAGEIDIIGSAAPDWLAEALARDCELLARQSRQLCHQLFCEGERFFFRKTSLAYISET